MNNHKAGEDEHQPEVPDRTWLPIRESEPNSTHYDLDLPFLHESDGSHSTDGSDSASHSNIMLPAEPALTTSTAPFDFPAVSSVFTDDFNTLAFPPTVWMNPSHLPSWNYLTFSDPFGNDSTKAFIGDINHLQNVNELSRQSSFSYPQQMLPSVMLGDRGQWMITPHDTVSPPEYVPFQTGGVFPMQPSRHTTNFSPEGSMAMITHMSDGFPAQSNIAPTMSMKRTKVSTRKVAKKPRNSRRSGPLDDVVRRKVEEMRDVGACWRCRKYKKPCNDTLGICESCKVPGFRVWPSELGCRRERLESLVLFLLPVHMEQKLYSLPEDWNKGRTWRVLAPPKQSGRYHDAEALTVDQWALSKKEVRSIQLFDADYAELACIAETYQSSRTKPIRALEASCTLLIATCKLYQCFINTPDCTEIIELPEIIKRAATVRISLKKTFVLVQQLCLSTKRTEWFPAFLSACLATCAAIVFLDTAIAVPSPVRELIWGNFHETRAGLRQGGYQLLVDLLRASTNGANPIKQECWKSGNLTKEEEVQKMKERYTLLGVDSAAMDGLIALNAWQEKYKNSLDEGRAMFAADAYSIARIRPIAGLCKMFDF